MNSSDGAPDAERTAKVQVPVTCEKVQSEEDPIMLLTVAFLLLLKLNSSVPDMLEEMKPYTRQNWMHQYCKIAMYESDL